MTMTPRRARLQSALDGGTSTAVKVDAAAEGLAALVKERRAAVPTETFEQAFAKVTARGEAGRPLLIALRSEGPTAEDTAIAKAFPGR